MQTNSNPLLQFSLTGQGHALSEAAGKQHPLLGSICLKGEITVWYAPPNTGKTLIALSLMSEAVSDRKIDPENVFYINADDSQAGFAEKVALLDDFGIHTLVPGQANFKLNDLLPAMEKMAQEGTANGKLVVVDTIKKITDIMDKRGMRNFGIRVRPFTMAGGTILFLAHTNKKRAANGDLIYAGTNDLLEDVDSAYLLDRAENSSEKQRLIRFACLKSRGVNANEVFYRYESDSDLSYLQKLTSVELVDPEAGSQQFRELSPETGLVEAVTFAIRHGSPPTKGRIVASVAKATKASKRQILDIIEKYAGPSSEGGLWDFEVHERGAHLFVLHTEVSEMKAET